MESQLTALRVELYNPVDRPPDLRIVQTIGGRLSTYLLDVSEADQADEPASSHGVLMALSTLRDEVLPLIDELGDDEEADISRAYRAADLLAGVLPNGSPEERRNSIVRMLGWVRANGEGLAIAATIGTAAGSGTSQIALGEAGVGASYGGVIGLVLALVVRVLGARFRGVPD